MLLFHAPRPHSYISSKALTGTFDIELISFMDKLNEVPTDNVEPLIFMNDEVNKLREDVSEDTLTQREALKNAPKKDSDYFRIPKVLDK
jgi:aspartyl-tRNA(Asn)/glutamyl-tRNA(Gln) amidotransferase subunit C